MNEINFLVQKISKNHPLLNAVLCNKYETGENYIGPHFDVESCLEENAFIASVSFGSNRDFVFTHKNTDEKLSLKLNSGDIILMGKGCQQNYKHSLPKRLRNKNPRINLTFRSVK